MADVLQNLGKVYGMTNIKNQIDTMSLLTNGGTLISTNSTVTNADFDVDGTTGQLSNNTSIEFTIEAGDVGETASIVTFSESGEGELFRIDLDSPVSLTTAGTASFASGNLTATL